MNTNLSRQRRRRAAREAQKPANDIPHLGVMLDATTIRRHRYRRARGLPHSERAASIMLPSDSPMMHADGSGGM